MQPWLWPRASAARMSSVRRGQCPARFGSAVPAEGAVGSPEAAAGDRPGPSAADSGGWTRRAWPAEPGAGAGPEEPGAWVGMAAPRPGAGPAPEPGAGTAAFRAEYPAVARSGPAPRRMNAIPAAMHASGIATIAYRYSAWVTKAG